MTYTGLRLRPYGMSQTHVTCDMYLKNPNFRNTKTFPKNIVLVFFFQNFGVQKGTNRERTEVRSGPRGPGGMGTENFEKCRTGPDREQNKCGPGGMGTENFEKCWTGPDRERKFSKQPDRCPGPVRSISISDGHPVR